MLPGGVICVTVAGNHHEGDGMGVGQPRFELMWDDQDRVSRWLTVKPL